MFRFDGAKVIQIVRSYKKLQLILQIDDSK